MEAGHIWRAAKSVVSLLWRADNVAGPLSYPIAFVIAGVIAWVTRSLAWGVVVIVSLLAVLLFAEIVRRERQKTTRSLDQAPNEHELILSAIGVGRRVISPNGWVIDEFQSQPAEMLGTTRSVSAGSANAVFTAHGGVRGTFTASAGGTAQDPPPTVIAEEDEPPR